MILFPMTQEQKSKVGTPIIPRSKVDPTQSARPVSKMFQDIEGRYLDIKRRLKVLFDQRLTGRQREVNGERSWLMCNNGGAEPSLYQVNAGTYIYDMTAVQLSAGGLYQVGEKGKPEIYQASTGKQYMIPGDNGKVISNKDMQSGGGISVQVNVINQSTGATVQSADGYMQDGSAVVDLLITDMERGGPVSSQMQQTFGLSRKAQGAY